LFALDSRVPLLAALYAFLQEHRRCGELDGEVDDDRGIRFAASPAEPP
jgi:hypothetical protein